MLRVYRWRLALKSEPTIAWSRHIAYITAKRARARASKKTNLPPEEFILIKLAPPNYPSKYFKGEVELELI